MAERETALRRMLQSPDRPVAGHDAAEELLARARRPWGFDSLAVGWMKIGVIATILLVIALGIIPIYMTYDIDRRLADSETQLREHTGFSTELARKPAEYASEGKVAEVARRYTQLAALPDQYRNEMQRLRHYQVIALSALGVMLALAAVLQYRRYIAVKRVAVAIAFLSTPEGIAWLQAKNAPAAEKAPGSS